MKRFKIVGLCLVAVFALSAVMASGASGRPVRHVREGRKSRQSYTANSRTRLLGAVNRRPNEGKYKWVANAAKIKLFSEGGESKLKGAAGEIACKHGTDSGEILNATENMEHVHVL